MKEPVLELIGITKYFSGIPVNNNINLKFYKGEIHTILGEKGVGKSTLMNIFFGLYKPDDGKILINNKISKIENSSDAIDKGINMIHQHFMFIPNFTVLENIVLFDKKKQQIFIEY